MLDKQCKILSVDTGNFYSNRERRLHILNHKLRQERKYLKTRLELIETSVEKQGYHEKEFKSMVKEHIRFLLNMQAIGFMDIFWSACRMELIGSNKND